MANLGIRNSPAHASYSLACAFKDLSEGLGVLHAGDVPRVGRTELLDEGFKNDLDAHESDRTGAMGSMLVQILTMLLRLPKHMLDRLNSVEGAVRL